MWGQMKRPTDNSTMSCAKVPNVGVSTQSSADGEWICPVCGNLNHAGRVVCNMRKCGAPKPEAEEERWTCACGNENYAGRLVCNLRKCGMLKPGLKLQDLPKLSAGQQMQAAGGRPAPPGSWKCIECGNVNYPTREVCNGRGGSCGLPRATADGGPPDEPQAHGGAGFGGFVPTPKASGPTSAPPGSWVCRSCGNVNFPTRTTCNSRNCGMSREDVDGGPAGFLAAKAGTTGGNHPVGSWTCTACGNVNFPNRTSCNARNCGLPRQDVDGGPSSTAPASFQAPKASSLPGFGGGNNGGDAPPGSWTCHSCGNVNWPGRTTCNRRNCGLPRAS